MTDDGHTDNRHEDDTHAFDGIELADAIESVRDQLTEAAARATGQPLVFELGDIQMEFTLELRKEVKGGTQGPGLGGGRRARDAGRSTGRTHKVSFTLTAARRRRRRRRGGSATTGPAAVRGRPAVSTGTAHDRRPGRGRPVRRAARAAASSSRPWLVLTCAHNLAGAPPVRLAHPAIGEVTAQALWRDDGVGRRAALQRRGAAARYCCGSAPSTPRSRCPAARSSASPTSSATARTTTSTTTSSSARSCRSRAAGATTWSASCTGPRPVSARDGTLAARGPLRCAAVRGGHPARPGQGDPARARRTAGWCACRCGPSSPRRGSAPRSPRSPP